MVTQSLFLHFTMREETRYTPLAISQRHQGATKAWHIHATHVMLLSINVFANRKDAIPCDHLGRASTPLYGTCDYRNTAGSGIKE